MTDAEKLDAIYKMVKEIREYIGNQPNCPQHLWSEARSAEMAARQRASLTFVSSQNEIQTSGWGIQR